VKKRWLPAPRAGTELGLTGRLVKRRLSRVGTTGRLPVTSFACWNVAAFTGCGRCGTRVLPKSVEGMVLIACRTRIFPWTAWAFENTGRPLPASGGTTAPFVTFRMFVMFVMFVMLVTLTTLVRAKPPWKPNQGKNGSHGPTGNQPMLEKPNPN